MKHGGMKAYYVFSPFTRIFHWVMVICVFTLFFTGLYIGNPFFIGTQGVEPTFAFAERLSMQMVRYIHFVAAWILVASFILRIYGFIIHKGDRLLPKFWTKLYWEGKKEVFLHYSFLKSHHRPFLRNSLARTGYATVYFLMFVEVVTGFAMYYMVHPNGFGAKLFGFWNHLLIDEYWVHIIHHAVAWFIMLFVVVHVYMAIRADFMERGGEISGMFSGVKYYEEEPADIGDIQDETNKHTGHRQHTITG